MYDNDENGALKEALVLTGAFFVGAAISTLYILRQRQIERNIEFEKEHQAKIARINAMQIASWNIFAKEYDRDTKAEQLASKEKRSKDDERREEIRRKNEEVVKKAVEEQERGKAKSLIDRIHEIKEEKAKSLNTQKESTIEEVHGMKEKRRVSFSDDLQIKILDPISPSL